MPCPSARTGKAAVTDKGWQREFEDPIALPDGRTLVTLRDAATYVTGLAEKDAALPEWQAAIEALILAADLGGPTMFARIGVMQALNRGVERGDTRCLVPPFLRR
jgi:hypothetical protein